MALHREPDVAGHLVESELEPGIREGLHPAAVVADRVVMVLAVRLHGLEAGDSGPEVDTLDEPHLGELLEHAVHARDPDRPARRPRPIEDLLSGQAARLVAEELDDGGAGAATAKAREPEGLVRVLDPA